MGKIKIVKFNTNTWIFASPLKKQPLHCSFLYLCGGLSRALTIAFPLCEGGSTATPLVRRACAVSLPPLARPVVQWPQEVSQQTAEGKRHREQILRVSGAVHS